MKKLLFLLLPALLFSQTTKNITVSMHGIIDDDLFVYKIKPDSTDVEKLYAGQMHNPNGLKIVDGSAVKTVAIEMDGKIDVDIKTSIIDEIVFISTANEREELHPFISIHDRTHYKNSPIYVNGAEAIQSILPEKKDLGKYPTLFQGSSEKSCLDAKGSEVGNYYTIWENAVVANAVILPTAGSYKVLYFDKNGNIQGRKEFKIDEKTVVTGADFGFKPMEEKGGFVYSDEFKSNHNQYLVEQNAVIKILIWNMDTGQSYQVPLVYGWPYLGLIKFMLAPEHKSKK